MNESDRKELVTYRLNKPNRTLKEIDILLKNELWNTAVNRMYYACYYAVSALLLQNAIQAQTHAGVRQMFGMHFIKPGKIEKDLGKFYTDIFDKRQTGDYEDFVEFEKEDVLELLIPTKQLVAIINQILNENQST